MTALLSNLRGAELVTRTAIAAGLPAPRAVDVDAGRVTLHLPNDTAVAMWANYAQAPVTVAYHGGHSHFRVEADLLDVPCRFVAVERAGKHAARGPLHTTGPTVPVKVPTQPTGAGL